MYEFHIVDLAPYGIIVVILTLLLVSKTELRKKAYFCFLVLFFFSAIRYGIGYDYYAYMKMVLNNTEDYSIERIEPLSRVLLSTAYHTHYQVFFVLSSFLTIFPLYRACIKLSINPAYSLIIYFLFPVYYLESFSIIRNAVAYSIVLYSFVVLNERKYLYSVVLIVIAALFHKSALISLLFYFIFFIKPGRLLNIIFYLSSFAISAFLLEAISQYADLFFLLSDVEKYTEVGRAEGGTMNYIVNGLNIINFLLWSQLSAKDKNNSLYLCLFNIGVCLWNAFLAIDSTISLRLSSFFMIFIIFLVPQYKTIFVGKNQLFVNRMVYLFFLILFSSYFYINVSAYLDNPERMSNIPYQTVFYHTDYDNYVY